MLKHILWRYNGSYGRAALQESEEQQIELHPNLSGPSLPAVLLLPALVAALGDDWINKAEALHASRACPWKVENYTGMSGAKNYRLRVLESETWGNAPLSAVVHVSMYDKLNEGLKLWLGDLPPLLAALLEDFPPPEEGGYSVEVHEATPVEGFTEAGASSGLPEIIAAMKAVEVLSE